MSGATLSAVAARVAVGLRTCRELPGAPELSDQEVERVHDALRRGSFDPPMEAIAEAIDGIADARRRSHRSTARAADALVELHALQHTVEELRHAHMLALLGRVRDSLSRLRAPETTRQILDLACAEACEACDLTMAIVLAADGSVLQVRHIDRTEDRVTNGMLEAVEAANGSGYVTAPLVVNGSVIATLHGDRHRGGEQLDSMTQGLVATFAEGVGALLERAALLEQVHCASRRVRALFAHADAAIEDLAASGFELGGRGGASPKVAQPGDGQPARATGLLTPRELEVIELMARGATNSEIATRLVISQTTVKSHVKHILRKMRASNRAQATSRYMRLGARSAWAED
jgi:DNA-binding CsgD family transcriptional regulator